MTDSPESTRPVIGRRAVMGLLGVATAGVIGGGAVLLPEVLRNDPLRRDPVNVPTLAGLPQAKAEEALSSVRLVSKTVQEDSDTVPAGTVISSDPAAGVRVREQDTVRLVVSTGPSHTTVPAGLVGMQESKALETIKKAGLETKASLTQHSATAPEGQVVHVSPASGADVAKGTKVVLTVASGKVVVPLLLGLSGAEAQKRLKSETVNLPSTIGYTMTTEKPAGTVVSQSVKPNTAVPRGTHVTLTVAVAPVRQAPAPSAKPSASPSGRASSSPAPKASSTPTSTPTPKKS